MWLYTSVYLFTRYRAGIVTDEMLAFPRKRFIAIGILEALGVVAGVSSADLFDVATLLFYFDLGGSDAGQTLSGISSLWPVLTIVSSAFMAGESILKESVFLDAAKRLKGKSIDIFVVISFGSGFQVLSFIPTA
ncbi:hypothetical protein V2J09_004332 [Rumex salicifolius]